MSVPPEIFQASVLVVAHPDDEVLWFSSVLGRVERAILCYEDCGDLPELGAARRRAMADYPLSTVTWLRRPEPGSVERADWSAAIATPYGMALNAAPADELLDARYRRAYDVLRADLRAQLHGARHVFTHNPWGEYGHPDHVQLSRVVADLRRELGFRLWYSSYVSPRSMAFAARALPALGTHLRLPTDAALVARIKAHYQRCNAWTWHSEHEQFPDEAWLEDTGTPPATGAVLPLHCVMT
jgi:LmbE family N-acetylglucosaminyl deacetylase